METSFVFLARVNDPNHAELLRARLNAEGIEARLHGEALGPYRLNIGAMAVTEIWVPPDKMDEARLVLLAYDIAEQAAVAVFEIFPGALDLFEHPLGDNGQRDELTD